MIKTSPRNYVLFFAIVFAMVYRLPVASYRLSYEMAALYFSSITFSIFLMYKRHYFVGLFLVLCTFASYYPVCSLTSVQSLRFVIVGVFLYYALCGLDLDKNTVYNALCVACLAHVIFLMCQSKGVDPYLIFGIKSNLSVTGLTANNNEASILIALCAPCFFRRWWWIAFPVLVSGLLISGATGGFVAFIAVCITWVIKNRMKIKELFDRLPVWVPTYFVIWILAVVLFCYGISKIGWIINRTDVSNRTEIWSAASAYYFKEGFLQAMAWAIINMCSTNLSIHSI